MEPEKQDQTALQGSDRSEASKARAFRESRHLTRAQLAALTGYTQAAIYMFERGAGSTGKPIDAHVWQRYKMTCLAARMLIEYGKTTQDWDWA